MKKLFLIFTAICLAVSVSACGQKTEEEPTPDIGEVVSQASEEPDSLTGVLELVYQNVTINDLMDASDEELTDFFHIEPEMVEDYAIRYSSGRYGVADVAIIKPAEGQSEAVLNGLETRRDDRIAEFQNYDIHDSLRIAKETEIFTRGDYVIMLMLADKQEAYNMIVGEIPG